MGRRSEHCRTQTENERYETLNNTNAKFEWEMVRQFKIRKELCVTLCQILIPPC